MRVPLASDVGIGAESRDYIVELGPGREGFLRDLRVSGAEVSRREYRGRRCWEFLERRVSPCPGCPLFNSIRPTAVAVLKDDETGSFRIVALQRQKKVARVRLCLVTNRLLAELVREKIRRLTRRARLSSQERKTLDRMLRGRHAKGIAAQLGITPRTVKFHMTNLRRKLGLQSRAAICSLILVSARSAPSRLPAMID